MKALQSIFIMLCVISLCASARGQATQPSDTFGQLSRSANEELAKSTLELSKLQEDIEAEKLPMANRLKSLEDKLALLRSKQDEVSRQADVSNLDSTNIKAATKALQDELNYVGGLLDEYSHTFETKINPTEMQYCGTAIEAAKTAANGNNLSQADKFAAQLTFVKFTTQRLFDVIGGMRFDGEAVDQHSIVAKGQFALIGPVVLFSNSTGSVAGLVLTQTGGSAKPLVRPLEPPMQAGLVALVTTGEGNMPLDPSLGAALKALVQRTNIYALFKKGGMIMWPLALASILSMGVAVERIFFLMLVRMRRDTKSLDRFFKAVGNGDINQANTIGAKSKFYVVRALGYALRHKEQSLPSALLYAEELELKKFRRGIPILDTVITLAPLMGLFGTITGMMGSFSVMGGEMGATGEITGGIAEALIATAFGLVIAMTSLIPYNILNNKLEEARKEMEAAANQLELLIHPASRKVVTVEAAAAHTAAVLAGKES